MANLSTSSDSSTWGVANPNATKAPVVTETSKNDPNFNTVNTPVAPVNNSVEPVSGDIKPVTPEVINKTGLQENIQGSLDVNPNLQANEAFIQGVAKLAGGQPATAEQLALKGRTLSEVITEFGVGEQFKGFGMAEPVKPEALTTEAPQTSQVASAYENLIAQKQAGIGETVDINAYNEKKNNANIAVEKSRQAIADKNLIDAVKLEEISKGQPIPMIEIQKQQAQFSADEYIDNLKMTQDYNNNLILANMAEGNFLEAQNINKSIAADNYEIEKLKIAKAQEEQRITENEAELLRQDEELAFNRAEAGYIQILSPDQLAGLTEDEIIRVGDKIYKKPVEEPVKGDFQFVTGTENQAGGVFDRNTGTFSLFNSSSPTGAGNVSTSTGDTYDIGSYATDPNHETAVQGMLSKMGQFKTIEDMDSYIQGVAPGSPVTGQMIANSASKYGVSWEMMTAIMQQDSSLGTKGLGSRNNNPGNVGQFDSLGTDGVEGYATMQDGVDAVAKNLAWRKVDTTEFDQEVSSFVDQVQNGSLTTNQALSNISKGKKDELITALSSTPLPIDTEADELAKAKMTSAINLLTHPGLNSSVGPVPGTRLPLGDILGAKQDFVGKIEQLISDLSLESLIEAKSRGATFGALSDTEMQILSNAATTMAQWRTKNFIGDKTDHYAIDEKNFKAELKKISDIFKRAIKSTIEEPDELPANSNPIETPDGARWIENEDGSFTLVN